MGLDLATLSMIEEMGRGDMGESLTVMDHCKFINLFQWTNYKICYSSDLHLNVLNAESILVSDTDYNEIENLYAVFSDETCTACYDFHYETNVPSALNVVLT